jgi:hypothetical protein
MNKNKNALNEMLDILKENNIEVELKNYKELQTQDGYHMQGTIYVNGKKALICEDGGFGGPLDVRQYLTKTQFEKGQKNKHAQLLIDIFNDEKILKDKIVNTIFNITNKEGEKSILYCDIDSLFYLLAEKFLEHKDMKKRSAKNIIYKLVDEDLKEGEFYQLSINKISNFKHTKDMNIKTKNEILKRICNQFKVDKILVYSSFIDWESKENKFKLFSL